MPGMFVVDSKGRYGMALTLGLVPWTISASVILH